jgi:hypothetical protein
MSSLSPGSKSATNLFMVLGVIAMIALAISVNRNPNSLAIEQTPAVLCEARLISMGQVVWDPDGPILHPGNTQIVSLTYMLTNAGEIEDIRVASAPSAYDSVAIRAAQNAHYASIAPDAEPLRCSHTFTLRLD